MEITDTLSKIKDNLGTDKNYRIQFDLIFAEYQPIIEKKISSTLSFGKYNSKSLKQRVFYKPYSKIINLEMINDEQ